MTDASLELSSQKAIMLDRIRRIADCIQRHEAAARKTIINEVGCLSHQAEYVLRLMHSAQLIHKVGPDHHPLWKLNRSISECNLEAIYQSTLRAKEQQGELNAEMQRLLETLRSENLCSKKDLMGLLGVAEHTIARQLSLLKIAGLVGYVCTRNGAKHWYVISPEMESEAIVPPDGKPIPLDSEHLAWMKGWREFRARRLAQQQRAIAYG